MKNTYLDLFQMWSWWLHIFDTSTVNLVQAWGLWIHGQLLDTHLLWGIKILTWERFGKVLSFVSGIVVITEIIGHERFANWGKSLKGVKTQTTTSTYLKKMLLLAATILSLFLWPIVLGVLMPLTFMDSFFKARRLRRPNWINGSLTMALYLSNLISIESNKFRSENPRIFYFNIVSSVAAAMIGFASVTSVPRTQSEQIVLSALNDTFDVIGWFLVPLMTIPVLLSALMLIINFLAFTIDKLIVNPLEWLLNRKDTEVSNLFKVVSVILLLIGFHFDLLGS